MSVIIHGPYLKERIYCKWFDGTVCEQPTLVCHGSQSHFHLHGVNSLRDINIPNVTLGILSLVHQT